MNVCVLNLQVKKKKKNKSNYDLNDSGKFLGEEEKKNGC